MEDLRDSLFVRIDDLFFEYDIDVNLNHKELYVDVENYQGEILKSISTKNGDLFWSVFIGIHTVNYITSKTFNTKMNAEYTNMLGEELSKHDSSIDALDLIISKHRKKALRNLDNRITCALEYFCLLLKGLKIEESVVFVAMPFSKEYLEYYKTYYRPVLTKSGYDCIRAWGELGHENYSEYMRILISRCGKMFADISGKNENVMYEVGVAHGQDKHVYLVTNDKDYPSNLCDDVVMYYDPSLPDWESSATDNFQMWFLAEQVGSGMRDQFVAKLNKIRDM